MTPRVAMTDISLHATTTRAAAADIGVSKPGDAADDSSDQPWLERKDWASRSLKDGAFGNALRAWGFGLAFGIPAAAVGVLIVWVVANEDNYRILLATPLPLVGIYMMMRAVQATLRYLRYGSSTFELETLPGVVGHGLSGTLRTRARATGNETFRATLSCVRLINSGTAQAPSERLLWQQELRVVGRSERDGAGGRTIVPLAFTIPRHVEPTDADNPFNQIVWRLAVTLEMPGVDYRTSFEVPVFRTAASAAPTTTAETGTFVSPWDAAAARLG
jgi:hypothetical protein